MILVYVDGENVSFSEFKEYMDTNLEGKTLVGKVYGDSQILGDSIQDYYRIGFDHVDTSHFSSSDKNVADMKIVTDCAFDTMHDAYDRTNLSIVIATRDCDFLPLVYKLQSFKIPVLIPTFGTTRTAEIPLSAVTDALQEHNYAPMETDEWKLPQMDYVAKMLEIELPYAIVDKYYNKKRMRFIHACMRLDTHIASELDNIPKHDFSAKSIFRVLRQNRLKRDDIIPYINLYTSKFFGKTFHTNEMRVLLTRLY